MRLGNLHRQQGEAFFSALDTTNEANDAKMTYRLEREQISSLFNL